MVNIMATLHTYLMTDKNYPFNRINYKQEKQGPHKWHIKNRLNSLQSHAV